MLILCPLGNFPHFFVVCWFFRNQLFLKILSGIRSECQTIWIQIRPDILSGLIWFQTVCESYQQMTLGARDGLKVACPRGLDNSADPDQTASKTEVLLLLIRSHCLWGFYVWSLYCYTVLGVHSSFAIILMRKRKLVALPDVLWLLIFCSAVIKWGGIWVQTVCKGIKKISIQQKSNLRNVGPGLDPNSLTLWYLFLKC